MIETNPEKRLIGYGRISTYGRTLDRQLEQLRAAMRLPSPFVTVVVEAWHFAPSRQVGRGDGFN
jgi:hypothetical protein